MAGVDDGSLGMVTTCCCSVFGHVPGHSNEVQYLEDESTPEGRVGGSRLYLSSVTLQKPSKGLRSLKAVFLKHFPGAFLLIRVVENKVQQEFLGLRAKRPQQIILWLIVANNML